MPLSASDLLRNADVFRRAYPHWPSAEPEEPARVSFLDAMFSPEAQREILSAIPPCPNEPPCEHDGLVHDIEDYGDPLPRCCVDGCRCGAATT